MTVQSELDPSTPAGRRESWRPLELSGESRDFVHASGDLFDSTDPATDGLVVARVAASTPADLDAAVAAARAAQARSPWASDGVLRQRVLTGFAAALRADLDRLAELLTLEQGKTLAESRVEVEGAARMVDYYAGLARAVYGRSAILGERVHGVVVREPVGVVAVITPWNWPLTLLARALAPALAAGNAAIVKPASLTPAITVEVLACLASQPDLPRGILGCVLGSGGVVGDALVGHEGVDMVSFTGETATGVHVMKRAADGLKKVSLELGGKSPNIVFADASMDKALAGVENAFFTTAGQICTAGARLLVEEAAYEPLLERLATRVRAARVGDGLDPATEIGPLVSRHQAESVRGFVERGRAEGELVAAGEAPDGPGCYVAPAVFAGLPAESSLLRQEIFGPVIAVQTFASDDEAIELANDTDYGLAAALWTQNLDRAWRVGRGIRAGTVWINTYNHFYDELEAGGFHRSGLGRQQGVDGLLEYTETKHLNFDGNSGLW